MPKRKAEEDASRGDLLVGSSLLDRYKRLKSNHDTDKCNQNIKLSNLCPNAPPFVSRKEGPQVGKWEDHTKGMGSLLMRKMGWVGAGLGAREQGRVELVTARMYPAGRSLDWCMQMRARFGDSVCQDVEEEAELQKQLVLQADKFGDFSFVSEFLDMRLEGGNNTEAELRKSHDLLRALKRELQEPGSECLDKEHDDDDTNSETEADSDDEDYLFESDSSSDFGFDGRAYYKHNGYRIYSDGDYEYDTYGIDYYD